MELSVLLFQLKELDVVLDKDGDRLKVSAPPGAITEDLAAAIRMHKPQLLSILGESLQKSGSSGTIARVEARTSYPLSPSQERNLFAAQNGPGMATAYVLKGPLDRQTLHSVLDRIVARHATLRSVLHNNGNGLVARVSTPYEVRLDLLDFSDVSPEGRALDWSRSEYRKRLVKFSSIPYVLDKEPLCRFKLCRISDNEHILALYFSQLTFDGTSFDLFLKEMTEGYSALIQDSPWPFPPLDIEYMDYVGWKYRLLGERGDRLIAWWKASLGDSVPNSPIPLDRPRPAMPDYRGVRIPLMIPADFANQIRDLAKKQGVTTQIVLLAAVFILVNRLSGRPDARIAMPIEGRRFPSLEPMIGAFTNLVLLRVDLQYRTPFDEFLPWLRDYCMTAYDNQDVPIERLGLRMETKGKSTRAPLYQLEFSYQQVSRRATMMGPLSIAQVDIHGGGAANELTLWVKDWGHMIDGAIEYETALYDRETATHWLGCYFGILRYVVEHPDAPLGSIDPLLEEGKLVTSVLAKSIGSLPGGLPSAADLDRRDLRLVDKQGRPVPLGVWADLVANGRTVVEGIRLKANGEWESQQGAEAGAEVEAAGRTVVPAQDRVQAGILEVWKKVLNQEGFGVTDSFFDLGGHSLLAISLIRDMNEVLGGQWLLRNLFETPTIEGLAASFGRANRARMPLLFEVNKHGEKPPLFIVPGVYDNPYYKEESNSAYEQDFLRYFSNILLIMGKERPIFGLRPVGIYPGEKFRETIDIMAREYIEEIKKVQPEGPYLIGGECLGGGVAYAIARALESSGDVVSTLLLMDTVRNTIRDELSWRVKDNYREIKALVKAALNYSIEPQTFRLSLQRVKVRYLPMTRDQRERRRFEFGPKRYTRILNHYRPERYDGKVLLVVNEVWNKDRPSLGWDKAICPRLEVQVVPGDHSTRLRVQNGALERCLRDKLG